MDWRLALVSLVGMPLALAPAAAARAQAARLERDVAAPLADISEILQETISGFRVVKAFGMEGFEIARFRRARLAPLRT